MGRTVERKDTWNKTSNQWMFPQTPSRVQVSLWPGGLASNAEGTIDWAGGVIDWDSQDIQDAGYYYTTISDITIECYKTDSPPGTNSGVSYTYEEGAGTNDTVIDGDKDTVLASLQGTGLDMDKGKTDKSSKTSSSDKADETAATIPNGQGTGDDHSGDSSDSSSSSSDSGSSDSGSSGSGSSDTTNCDPSDFSIDCGSDSTSADGSSSGNGGGNGGNGSSRAGASVLAIIVAGCALFWL